MLGILVSEFKQVSHWAQASRLPSQVFLLLPLVLGYSLVRDGFSFSFDFFLALLFASTFQMFIVFVNDYGDYEADKANHQYTFCSGGSRVLVEGKLTPVQLLQGIKIVFFIAMLSALCLSWSLFSLVPIGLALFGVFLIWAYSYEPYKASYKGYGEFLQTVGLAFVIPLLGFISSGLNLARFPFEVLLITFPTQFACALATSLPDLQADRQSGKLTLAVKLGKKNTIGLIWILNSISTLLFGLVYSFNDSLTLFIITLLLILHFIFPRSDFGEFKFNSRVFIFLLFTISIQILIIGYSLR